MLGHKTLHAIAVAGLLAFSSASNAAVYDFGKLLTGYAGAPDNFASEPFAQLVTVDKGSVWEFTLTINNNLFSSFGNDAFIGSMTFDFYPDPTKSGKKLTNTFISSNVGGVTSVYATNGTGLSGLTDIDFGTAFGKGAGNRLSQNDYVTWSVAGLTGDYVNSYVHVQGINGCKSAKYTPLMTPVPEPESYAMLLAGLGLVGFTARRRKHVSAWVAQLL